MASTYSALKIELIATGEQAGTWGATTNVNLGDAALGEAITGSADVAFTGADVTITLTDTNTTQSARNLRLNLTGTSGGARNLILGSGCQIEKLYLVNNGLADAVTVKNTTGTGIAVAAGKTMFVYNNGTNVVDAITHLTSLTTGVLSASGATTFTAGTASTSTTTGTAVITGGLGVSGRINAANFDGIVGANTAAAGSFTTINASTSITNAGLTSGRVTFAGASGLLSDSANLTFDGNTLSLTNNATATSYYMKRTSSTAREWAIGIDGDGGFRLTDANSGTVILASLPGAITTLTSAGDLVFKASSTERMRITSAGDVGIGTTSPAAKLQINAATDTIKTLGTSYNQQIYDCSAGFSQAVWQYIGVSKALINASASGMLINTASDATAPMIFATGSGATERMRIDSSGILALGISSGYRSAAGYGIFAVNGTSGSLIDLYASGTRHGGVAATGGGMYVSSVTATPLIFSTTDIERARIDSSGNVLVGSTTVPTGVSQRVLQVTNGTNGIVVLGSGATLSPNPRIFGGDTYDLGLAAGVTTGKMVFYTNDTERMRIDSAGLVGIGTSSITAKLEVKFDTTVSASNGAIGIENAGYGEQGITFTKKGLSFNGPAAAITYNGSNIGVTSAGYLSFRTNAGTDSFPTERMRINSSGNVGIGTTSPEARLHVLDSTNGGTIQLGSTTVDAGTSTINLYGQQNYINFRHRNIGTTTSQIFGGPAAFGTDSSGYLTFSTSTTGGVLTERARIDSNGNLLVGATSTTSSVSNTKYVVGGTVYSFRGELSSLASGTAYTMFTMTADYATYIVTCSGIVSAAAYSETAIVHINNTSVTVTIIADGSVCTISNSGLNVQYTQSSGVSMGSMIWSAIRIL